MHSDTKTTFQRDTHFLDARPVNVTAEDIDVILQDMISVVELAFFCMENREVCAMWLTRRSAMLLTVIIVQSNAQQNIVYL
jgi:hypothetical protein